jgi:hypothetical protein
MLRTIKRGLPWLRVVLICLIVGSYAPALFAAVFRAVVQVTSGDGQRGAVATTLPNPLVVTVYTYDNTGNPVIPTANIAVVFSVISPPGATGAAVSNATAVTGSDGTASTWVTLGNLPGQYQVTAGCAYPCFSTIDSFSESAVGGFMLAKMEPNSGDNQVGNVRAILPQPLAVQVTNQAGLPPAPPVTITFEVTQPTGATGATLTTLGIETAPDGTASTQLTPGDTPGQYVVTASCTSCIPQSVIFNEIANCQANLTTRWSQGTNPQSSGHGPPGGGPWGTQTYDHYDPSGGPCVVGDTSTNCKIQKLGCALTAVAMALRFKGIPLDPGTLNDFMKQDGLFNENRDVEIDSTAQATSKAFGMKLKLNAGSSGNSRSTTELRQLVCKGAPSEVPVIVGVHLTSNAAKTEFVPHHYDLVIGVTEEGGEQFQIVDPGHHNTTVLDPNDFVIRGYIADPPGDISRLDLAVGDNAEVLVVDPSGQRTGFDETTSTVVEEIPNGVYFRDSSEDDETGALSSTSSHSVHVFQPPPGTFTVVLSGLHLGTYELSVRAISFDGSAPLPILMQGIANAGSTATYVIQFAATPGVASTVARMATFQGVLADISNGVQLGLIEGAGLGERLSEKIERGAKAAAGGKTEEAREALRGFKREVRKHSTGRIEEVAAQVLLEDADSLLSQLLSSDT